MATMHYRIHVTIWAPVMFLLFITGCQESPLSELLSAKEALQAAQGSGAAEYAPEVLKEAEDTFQKAEQELAAQDEQLFFLRDYAPAKTLLTQAKRSADSARVQAHQGKDLARNQATTTISEARARVDEARILLAKAPTGKGTQADLQAIQGDLKAAETLVSESEAAIQEEDFRGAAAKAQSAEKLAGQVGEHVTRAIEKTQHRKR